MPVKTNEEVKSKAEEKISLPFVLMLWNDDVNSFEHVIDCLIKVCKHSKDQATQCAYLVHFSGKCDVKRGDEETVRDMYDKLQSAGLSVTIETA